MNRRIVFLDYMRVIACFMVIIVHSCEFFFIDGSNIGIASLNDGFWVSVFDSAFRCSVPLFVLISAYLLVPVTGSIKSFFTKLLIRVSVRYWFSVTQVAIVLIDNQQCNNNIKQATQKPTQYM